MNCRLAGLLLVALLASSGLTAQGLNGYRLDSDEVTVSLHPYSPVLVFSSNVNLVQIDAIVRRAGKVVDGLTAKDFAVRDNGKPQTIVQFSILRNADAAAGSAGSARPATATAARNATTSAPRPAYIAFFIDDANTSAAGLLHARDGILSFVGARVPADRHIAIATASSVGSVGFTQDAGALAAALKLVSPHPGAGTNTCPPISGFEAERIVNQNDTGLLNQKATQAMQMNCSCANVPVCYRSVQGDAEMVWQRARDRSRRTLDALSSLVADLAHQPGPGAAGPAPFKAIILASDGFLLNFDLQPQMNALIADALRDGIVVDALSTKGVVGDSSYDVSQRGNRRAGPQGVVTLKEDTLEQSDAADGMSDLAVSTGGTFLQGTNDLRHAVRDLASAPEEGYMLAFLPADLKPDGSVHKLTVSVTAPGRYDVKARPGYVAPGKTAAADAALRQTLRQEVMARDPRSALQIKDRFGKLPDGDVQLIVSFNPRQLPLQRVAGRNRDRLTIVAALFNSKGAFVTGVEPDVLLDLRDDSLGHFNRSTGSIGVGVPLDPPSGSYWLREVVLESQKGLLGATFGSLMVGSQAKHNRQ